MRRRLSGLVLLLLAGCITAGDPAKDLAPLPPTDAEATCEAAASFRAANLTVAIETTKGTIEAVLYGARSPATVCNFLRYVEEDYYDGTVWHRVCPHVIQAGGYDPYAGQQKAGHEPVSNEANESRLRNHRGTLGMARDSDPDSATSHFYVNLRENVYLDWDGPYAPGYAVFGNVTRGWDVVEAIASTPTRPDLPGGCDGVPLLPSLATVIEDIRVAP